MIHTSMGKIMLCDCGNGKPFIIAPWNSSFNLQWRAGLASPDNVIN
jgi:hypothetical protein